MCISFWLQHLRTASATRFLLSKVHICELWHGPTLAFKGDHVGVTFIFFVSTTILREWRPHSSSCSCCGNYFYVDHACWRYTHPLQDYNQHIVQLVSRFFLTTIFFENDTLCVADGWMVWQTLECKFSLGFFRCVTDRERRRACARNLWRWSIALLLTHLSTLFYNRLFKHFLARKQTRATLLVGTRYHPLSLASLYFDVWGIHLDLLFNSKTWVDLLNIHFATHIYLSPAVILVLLLLRLAVALIISVHCTLYCVFFSALATVDPTSFESWVCIISSTCTPSIYSTLPDLLDIIVLYPAHGRVSRIQEAQLTARAGTGEPHGEGGSWKYLSEERPRDDMHIHIYIYFHIPIVKVKVKVIVIGIVIVIVIGT